MRFWIVIADAARAKIYATTGQREPLLLVQELINPHGREKPQDIVTDDPGKYAKGGKWGRIGTWSSSMAPDVVEEKRFAQQVAEVLQTALARRTYDAVAILAPPKFLGFLRHEIGAQVAKHLVTSAAKDLTSVKARDLAKYLAPVIRESSSKATLDRGATEAG